MVFHVRDAAPVQELMAALHAEWRRKNSRRGGKRGGRTSSGKGGRARIGEHPPLALVDDNHLVAAAPTRAWANRARRAIETALGDAVEHVETKSIKVPKAAGGAGPGSRGRR